VKRYHLWLIGLAFLLHAPSFFRPFYDSDAGSYAAIACRLLDGGLPYRDGVENKFPLIFYTYKLIFELFGRYNMLAVHVVVTLVAIATAFTCAAIARRLGGERAAFWAGIFYVVFSASYYPKMLDGNTEMFAVLPSALAVWAYLEGRERPVWLVAAGAFAAATLLYKQVAAATFAALAADAGWRALRGRAWLRGARELLLLSLGLAAVLGAMVWHLHRIGVWDEAIFWSWTYIFRHYLPSGTKGHGFLFNALTSLLPFLGTVSPLVYLAWRGRRRELAPIYWWLLGSLCASLVGGRMYGHYFLLFVPALCVLGGLGAEEGHERWLGRILAVIAIAFFVFAVLLEGATGNLWKRDPDYFLASHYVRERTRPNERIFVWGWFPGLYVEADRCPSTRFVYTHLLSGSTSREAQGHNVPEAWRMLMSDLEKDPPAFILDTSLRGYSFEEFPLENYPELWQFVSERYRVDTELAGVRIYKRR
jgi:4-amino-4-deoxy-L-arabinose transferase-like glycosyltransferase